ncbi:type VI secretion system baseplate subunit TssG [Paraburkholderia sp. MMS20-SJTR3]|uniref:Type VI secretion system baseplate subunit TssG n=1 Tax=Paraburkholderia sejongensis TaxID=2886946 RepID=A0ABS8JRI3_9BURK|nr:type VI secretion system baseplate subunit TssG [Paraburkholderia sp. MMS20-SJTR3]MCC8392519.1 type VI secretion system baseplate subunit TssG [Paraburkholderia sp. MMS20-SJTR3]
MRNPADLLSAAADTPPASPAAADDAAGRLHALELLFEHVAAAPHQYDFFQLMRQIEALAAQLPRLGTASRPADEPIRLAQEVSLAFAPAPLAALTRADERVRTHAPRLSQRFFGLLGPNGPLPLHLTDFARERIMHHGDAAFAHMLDMLLHRFLLLFYRAWSQGRPATSMDRPDDRFAFYVGSLIGFADDASRRRDAASDFARLHFAGLLNMQTRPFEALEAIAGALLRVTVRVEPFCGHWMPLERAERTVLHTGGTHAARSRARSNHARLGGGAVLGIQVWDRQHKFRLAIGPLSLAQYEALLPGGDALAPLVAIVRQHLNRELAWDAKLILRADEVPVSTLGRYGRLGYCAWLAQHDRRHDAADLALAADTHVPL